MAQMEKIGEIISVESSFIVAEGSANMLPSLGSLIKTNDSSCYYFLVVSLFTESRTPGRIPIAYGKQIDVLKKEQPQIFELMKWGFRAVPVGKKGETGQLLLPEHLPEIHSLLYLVSSEELKEIFGSSSFIDTLFCIDSDKVPERDEAIMRLIKNYIGFLKSDERSDALLDIAGKITLILRDDYTVLKRFIGILGEYK